MELSSDMSVYEDMRILKAACHPRGPLKSVTLKSLGELRSLDTLCRWNCKGKSGLGHHNDRFLTPRQVITAELEGKTACDVCQKLLETDEISAAEFKKAKAEHTKTLESIKQRAKEKMRGGGHGAARYVAGGR